MSFQYLPKTFKIISISLFKLKILQEWLMVQPHIHT